MHDNTFCRVCCGRSNLKYPPAAVDSENKKPSSHTISVRLEESGEISDNICLDCEDTLRGFVKGVAEDHEDEEEPVVVDDDEILYKNLEKTKRIHSISKRNEIIEILSSESEHEEDVTVPSEDDIVKVESASTVVDNSKKSCDLVNEKIVPVKKDTPKEMNGDAMFKKDTFTRRKVVESMKCPLCPYLSGIEYEMVFHIRHTHPQYTGEHLRFDHNEADSILTRRLIFVNLWTFFECKTCGKIHDRLCPHRKHLTSHDRKYLKNTSNDLITLNNNEVQCSKRPFTSLEVKPDPENPKVQERVLRRTSKDNNTGNENRKAASMPNIFPKSEIKPKEHVSKKSKSQGLLRKQQLMQAKREKRRQKRALEKKAASKIRPGPTIQKPTFKMPQQPAPRSLAVVKQLLNDPPRFACKLCSNTFSSFISFNIHMLRVHSKEEFKKPNSQSTVCRKCGKKFTSSANLDMHFRLSHRRKNRLVEINGNDNGEICRQTLTPTKKKPEDEQQPGDSLSLINGLSKAVEWQPSFPNTALVCEYCGELRLGKTAMSLHESRHVENSDVKRIFRLQS